MRTFRSIHYIVLALALTLLACKKDDSAPATNTYATAAVRNTFLGNYKVVSSGSCDSRITNVGDTVVFSAGGLDYQINFKLKGTFIKDANLTGAVNAAGTKMTVGQYINSAQEVKFSAEGTTANNEWTFAFTIQSTSTTFTTICYLTVIKL